MKMILRFLIACKHFGLVNSLVGPRRIILLCILFALNGCSAGQNIETIRPGILTVAVTSGTPTGEYDSQLWIRRYIERFSEEHNFIVSWVVVPFYESWLLASKGEVDLVATNVASFSDRVSAGATFSAPFLFERRALRIRPEDQDLYSHINDFIGKRVGVVSGMAAERDVNSLSLIHI